MSSISPAVKLNKGTTSLPPISDIFRGPAVADPYYPPQTYGAYRGMPPVPGVYPNTHYQIATPDYGAPRYYGAPYGVPGYSFAGETGYGGARSSWRQGAELPNQMTSPLQLQSVPTGLRTSPGSRSMPEIGRVSPDYGDSLSLSREMSPKAHHMTAGTHTKVRTRNNLPKEVTNVLIKWLKDHLNHPYPNSFEKAQLIMATGLNQQQLSNWFINARRRKIKYLRDKVSS